MSELPKLPEKSATSHSPNRNYGLGHEHPLSENGFPLMPITVRVPKAVELTGLSRTKLYELIKSNEIEIIKVGASTLIVVASLQQFVERRRS